MPINSNNPSALLLSVFLSGLPEGSLKRLLFQDNVPAQQVTLSLVGPEAEPVLWLLFSFGTGDKHRAVWNTVTDNVTYFDIRSNHRRPLPVAEDSWYLTIRSRIVGGETPYSTHRRDWEAWFKKNFPDMLKDYHNDEPSDGNTQPVHD